MKDKITVLIIEDSALMRRELAKIINSDEELLVIGTARNGPEGLKQVKKLAPDVVTIDLKLPGDMDGITCLQYIMLESPRPCIIISAYTGNDSIEAFEALELYGCFRLAARIKDLRDEGHDIHTERVEVATGKRIAEYTLIKEATTPS